MSSKLSSSSSILLAAGAQIYIPDNEYAWLPAILKNDIHEGDATATVGIALPADWEECTAIPVSEKDSTLLPSGSKTIATKERQIRLAEFLSQHHDPKESSVKKGKLANSSSMSKSTTSKRTKPKYHFPLVNTEGGSKSDMADLVHLHGAAVLYNIKDRHSRRMPYTRVGDIIVAVNPYMVSNFFIHHSLCFHLDCV